MTILALSDSDVLALSILAVALCAVSVLGGGLFWIMFRNAKKAKEHSDVFRGLEDVLQEEYEPTKGADKQEKQGWEKDADWWKE